MIRRSFIFLPKVRQKTEQAIWRQNILHWDDFADADRIKGFSRARKDSADRWIREFRKHVLYEDTRFLSRVIPFSEQWRLYNEFRDEAVFLDIETSGYYGDITVVGLYDGDETKTFVRGSTLDKRLFLKEMQKYKMIVTFNGASFDLPVIKRYFGIGFHKPHVDLRFVCKKIGLTGGLKAVERKTGIKRDSEVDDMTGQDAPLLWNAFRQTKNPKYLHKLVKYNEEDIVNLKPLADFAVQKLWKQTFINRQKP